MSRTRNALGPVHAAALPVLAAAALALPLPAQAQQGSGEVSFSRDIAPILQKSCQPCHNPTGVAPMSLVSYPEARRYASRIAERTSIRDRMRAMPPWYIEKDVGIQHYKNDPSLSDAEIAAIQAWVAQGAPEGDPGDLPPALEFAEDIGWKLGTPDLIVSTDEITVGATDPDWWGDITPIPTGLAEDRYVASVEIREINDAGRDGANRATVGGRYVFHHMVWSTRNLDDASVAPSSWPVHEVGRNPDVFDPMAGRILRAGSSIVSNSVHLHSNGRDTKSRLEIGFRFHPVAYEPEYRQALFPFGNGSDIDIRAGHKDQELHAYIVLPQHTKLVTFEPHLHAPGDRMCIEAIWGFNIETLTCAGYDHNWVRGYAYDDDHAPLLPAGTILHITGYMNNTPENPNLPDTRNWQGSGNRSVANMFIDLGERLFLTDEQFIAEMAQRRERLDLGPNDHVIGCPLCLVLPE